MGKRFVRVLSRTVDNTVLLTLLVFLFLSGYAFLDNHIYTAAADAGTYAKYKPSRDDTKSFEELRAMNKDVIGWITIYDTVVDYPVLRSPNSNDDYLSRNPEGRWEGAGSLFLDHDNKPDFSDFDTIIFGHHMAGPTMFGGLDFFLEKPYFDKHEYANLFFSEVGADNDFQDFYGKNHGVQFFAMIQADAHNMSIYKVPSVSPESRRETLNQIAQYAILARNLQTGETRQLGKAKAGAPLKTGSVDPSFFGVNENDHIVLLSTCSADITNGRLVLCGKLLDHEVPDPFPKEEEQRNVLGIDMTSVFDTVIGMSVIQWFIVLILLLLVLSVLYRAERQRLMRRRAKKKKAEEEKTP